MQFFAQLAFGRVIGSLRPCALGAFDASVLTGPGTRTPGMIFDLDSRSPMLRSPEHHEEVCIRLTDPLGLCRT